MMYNSRGSFCTSVKKNCSCSRLFWLFLLALGLFISLDFHKNLIRLWIYLEIMLQATVVVPVFALNLPLSGLRIILMNKIIVVSVP